jgi:hypothetical protein
MNGPESQPTISPWLSSTSGPRPVDQWSSSLPTGPLGTWQSLPSASIDHSHANSQQPAWTGATSAFELPGGRDKDLRSGPSKLRYLVIAALIASRVYSQYEKFDQPHVPTIAERLSMPVANLAQTAIALHSDGCTVIRPEVHPTPKGLGWSIKNQAGFEVLQRNALGETQFRFGLHGTYTVELTAWDGTKYGRVSNRLNINC